VIDIIDLSDLSDLSDHFREGRRISRRERHIPFAFAVYQKADSLFL
jgi:hypothetical protein